MTWLSILHTPPKGDKWYILAHQYIAALLNQASGADVPPEVQAALSAASAILEECDFAVGSGQLATILESYNAGTIGPGHCDDDDDDDDVVLVIPLNCSLPLRFWINHPELRPFDTQVPCFPPCNVTCETILNSPLPGKNDPTYLWVLAAREWVVFFLNTAAGAFFVDLPAHNDPCVGLDKIAQALRESCESMIMAPFPASVVTAALPCVKGANRGTINRTQPCPEGAEVFIADYLGAVSAMLRDAPTATPPLQNVGPTYGPAAVLGAVTAIAVVLIVAANVVATCFFVIRQRQGARAST
jgi:hypothetical protein